MKPAIEDSPGEGEFVFVSYAHLDIAIAAPEIEFLQDHGWRTWFDQDINPGGEWRDEIAAAIRNARLLVFFVTPNSVASVHCRREVLFALDVNTPVLPVYLVPTRLPDSLSFVLSDRQAIHRYNIEDQEYASKLDMGLVSGSRNHASSSATSAGGNTSGIVDSASALLLILTPELRGGDGDLEFFFDGITEDITAALSKSNWIEVADSELSNRFSTLHTEPLVAANQIGADYLLKGNIREVSGKIRGRFDLINVRRLGGSDWGMRYSDRTRRQAQRDGNQQPQRLHYPQ